MYLLKRKKGTLPFCCIAISYNDEYGRSCQNKDFIFVPQKITKNFLV